MCTSLLGREEIGGFYMRTKRIICLLLFIVVVSGTVNTAWAPKPTSSIANWTFMVYMAADNNLDAWAYESLSYMEAVELTEEVNVLVLWDGYYEPAYMYKIVNGGHELVRGFSLNGEEVNMGDSTTLKAFVDFATKKFQAQHYLLDLWDHGDDFTGSCWDEHPDDYLTHEEVVTGLAGNHIDILAYDTCLEAMIEVAYEYNAGGMQLDYLVACENYIPLYGYPYDEILENLTSNPDMSPLEFAIVIATEYVEFYEPRAHFNGGVMATLSVIDISMADEAVVALADLTMKLESNIKDNHNLISQAKGAGNLPWSEYGWESYIDLPSFARHIKDNAPNVEIEESADNLLSILQQDVIKAVVNSKPMDSANALGLGIWFPPSSATQWTRIELETYETLQFASQGWLDFLYAYWGSQRGVGGSSGRKR